MNFPNFYPNDKFNFEKIIDNQLLVYKSHEKISKIVIGDQIKISLQGIEAAYEQDFCKKEFFKAEELNVDVLKPAEESKWQNWKYSDIKKIQIKKLNTKINQVR